MMLISNRLRKMKLKGRRSLTGFTLIEIIIVIVVITMVIATLLSVYAAISQNVVIPYITQVASQLAEEQFERVTGLRFSQVVSEGPTVLPAPFDSYSYQITVSAVPDSIFNDPLMTRYKQVDVVVTHATVGRADLVTIVTNN